jgi:hypothetical protein
MSVQHCNQGMVLQTDTRVYLGSDERPVHQHSWQCILPKNQQGQHT